VHVRGADGLAFTYGQRVVLQTFSKHAASMHCD
jgi:hypothetical protein